MNSLQKSIANSAWTLVLILSLALAVTYIHYTHVLGNVFLRVTLSGETESRFGVAQLFVDEGSGYLEQTSQKIAYMCDNQVRTLSFHVPYARKQVIRFDPFSDHGTSTIVSMEAESQRGQLIFSIPIDIVSHAQVQQVGPTPEGGITIRTVENAQDPSLFLLLRLPLFFENLTLFSYLFFFFLRIMLVELVIWFIVKQLALGNRDQKISSTQSAH